MKSKRIININAKELPGGGASVVMDMNYETPKPNAMTALAKSLAFLNDYAERMGLGVELVARDPKTKQRLYPKMSA